MKLRWEPPIDEADMPGQAARFAAKRLEGRIRRFLERRWAYSVTRFGWGLVKKHAPVTAAAFNMKWAKERFPASADRSWLASDEIRIRCSEADHEWACLNMHRQNVERELHIALPKI